MKGYFRNVAGGYELFFGGENEASVTYLRFCDALKELLDNQRAVEDMNLIGLRDPTESELVKMIIDNILELKAVKRALYERLTDE